MYWKLIANPYIHNNQCFGNSQLRVSQCVSSLKGQNVANSSELLYSIDAESQMPEDHHHKHENQDLYILLPEYKLAKALISSRHKLSTLGVTPEPTIWAN